ncbi:MAG: carbohydrate ABC transporter substrate-binding protein [Actinobacteria bacterium]|nr:carbohydrate ABC transporter substrate-binding protein [Actinomycetota bacterium]
MSRTDDWRADTGLVLPEINRRQLLRGIAGAAGLAAFPGLLAACSSTSGTSTTAATGGGKATGSVTVGSNASDQVPKDAYQKVYDAFQQASGITVNVNTVDHNTFQEQINSYLQGKPDDLFTWFAGFRMQFFAEKGLASPIDDVWAKIGSNYSSAMAQASTGLDGKKYFVPFYNYPWAIFYRKSVFSEKGYQIPKTMDELKKLGDQMKSDGLVPIAFADKDGWPAMGTFDYLDMRINGYDFHIGLMAGKESWEDKKVTDVFEQWAGLLEYLQPGALGRTWQEAAQSLVKKESGMYLLGMFVGQQFPDADRSDLDFFAFPEINPTYGTDSVEAPIDGFMMSKSPSNRDAAVALLEYLGTPEAQLMYLASDPNNVAAAKDVSTTGYNALQKKAAELISGAKHISQFMDRDTRPDFASTVMIPALQSFLNNPKDITGLQKSIQAQKVSIFAS